MSIPAPEVPRDDESSADQRVTLFSVPWGGFEAQLALRGDAPIPRVAYLDGAMELMSPSVPHERIKANLGHLIVAYALERNLDLQSYGSWLLRSEVKASGLEPDECFIFGSEQSREPERPDLAIEVVWTHGGLDKLEIYRRLAVPEVWFWRRDAISIFVLRNDGYAPAAVSKHLPELDLALLASFVDRVPMTQAIREYRKALAR